MLLGSISIFLVIILAAGLTVVKVFKEYERGVVFRLGRLVAFRGPGLSFVIPFIEKMVRVDLRTLTLNVPPQDVITTRQRVGKGRRRSLFSRGGSE